MDSEASVSSGRLPLHEEIALVKQAQMGDAEAFGGLYRAYVQAIYRYLLARLSDPQLAEDMTADVFLRAVDSLPNYSEKGRPFGAWLFRIAHDRLVDHYRRSARRSVDDLGDDFPSSLASPDAAAETQESFLALGQALLRLTGEQRDVIQFRYIEEWSLKETAQAMNKSVNAIKALQFRALAALSRMMFAHQSDPTITAFPTADNDTAIPLE